MPTKNNSSHRSTAENIQITRDRILACNILRNGLVYSIGEIAFQADYSQGPPMYRIWSCVALGTVALIVHKAKQSVESVLHTLEMTLPAEPVKDIECPVLTRIPDVMTTQVPISRYQVSPVIPHPTAPEDLYLYQPPAEQ